MLKAVMITAGLIAGVSGLSHTEQTVQFTDSELAIVKSFGPWEPRPIWDQSNRFSGNLDAIKLGRQLFFDPALSVNGRISCHGCHDPQSAFTDGSVRSEGIAQLDRNALALANLNHNRWFGWDGRSDSLWAQSIHPILDDREMGITSQELVEHLVKNQLIVSKYKKLTNLELADDQPDQVLVNIAKFLAAFQETLITPKTEFDLFLDNLLAGNQTDDYPDSAKRGLKLFIGDGQCFVCHFGPNFTNQEFSNNALPHFLEGGRVDAGRFLGLKKYQSEPFNRSGPYSDQKPDNDIWASAKLLPRNWGEFRVPSLRNVKNTAPYMHDGSLKTLKDVVDHYSNIDPERLHTDGENILKPLQLDDQQTQDLIAFLETLTGNPSSRIR